MKEYSKAQGPLLLLLLFLTGIQGLSAQGTGTFNLSLSGLPADITTTNAYFNNGDKGRYWTYEYDPCEAKLKALFYLYKDGDVYELTSLSWSMNDGQNQGSIDYIFGETNTSGGYTRITAPLTGSTPLIYRSSGKISEIRFFAEGDHAFLEFAWHLPTSGSDGSDVYDPDYDIDVSMTVAWDENTFSDDPKRTKNFTLEPTALDGLQAAPTATKTSVGNDEPAVNIKFTALETCGGTYTNGKGPFYRLKRYIFNPGDNSYSLDKTFDRARYPNNSTQQTVTDSGNEFDQCAMYSYSLETIVINDQGEISQGESGYSTAFSYTTILPEPDVINASQNSCDGAVTLNWTWSGSTPDGFIVQRKLPGEGDFTTLETIDGTLRSYSDQIETAFQSQNILYRIKTLNACGSTDEADLTEVTGIAPAALEVPTGVTATVIESGGGKFIRLGWDDNSSSESKYIITRQFQSGGGLVTYELDANSTSYDDLNVAICQPYRYQVRVASDCAPNGIHDEDEEVEIVINTDISEVIQDNSLQASRGYFKDRVELTWEVFSEFNSISRYKIYSRPLGSEQVPVLVSVVNGSERTVDDVKAEAGQLLEYFIIGETDCGDNLLTTNDHTDLRLATQGVAKAVGFRSPTGVINGNIAYSGGNAVKDVKVVVESAGGALGKSLYFSGNGKLEIEDPGGLLNASSNQFGVSLYVKPDFSSFTTESTLMSKEGNFRLRLDSEGNITWDMHDGSGWVPTTSASTITDSEFTNINVTYDGTNVKIYLNGLLDKEEPVNVSLPDDNQNDLVIGELFYGNIDEVTVWNKARTATSIKRDFVRLLSPGEEGLSGYWPAEVGYGSEVFDASKRGNAFNGNDGSFTNVTWSDEIPSSAQLSTIGYTNGQGNYTISGVKFKGEGENFEVTPILGVHEFSPSQKVIFIGEGNLVQNSVDFEDKSAFTVSGKVVFDFNGTKVGSEGVSLLVDGQPVFGNNGERVLTDEDGQFSIQVPIGDHVVQVEREDHSFDDNGRFPADSEQKFNFNEPQSGLEFIDNTRRKLVGKVVGGTREGDKPVGFDKTVNNIGQTRFLLVSSNGLIQSEITTNLETGEFETELPPLLYQIKQPLTEEIGKLLKVSENTTITGPISQMDLSSEYLPTYDTDTVLIASNEPLWPGTIRIDTVDNGTREVRKFDYDFKFNQIIRTVPEVAVYDGSSDESRPFLGIDDYAVTMDGSRVNVPLKDTDGDLILPYPTIISDNSYQLRIEVSEKYTNMDSGNPVIDEVPVSDAEITIDNNMMQAFYLNEERRATSYGNDPTKAEIRLNTADGDTTISFLTLDPEFNSNANPALSYTRSFKVTVVAGGNVVSWPNPNNQNEVQRVYVLGSGQSENNSFVTAGPTTVEYIIRDPYGGESYAFLEKGSTLTLSKQYSYTQDKGNTLETGMKVGFGGTNVGLSADFAWSSSIDSASTITTEITTTQTFQTRDDAQEVGVGGDLYISNAQNYLSGFARTLSLVEIGSCTATGIIQCMEDSPVIDHQGKEYKLGRTLASYLEPDSNPTFFVYTQNHIINTLIPDLKMARNSVLALDDRYESKLNGDDPNYGLPNDHPSWGNGDNDPKNYVFEEDSDGPSYKFTPETPDDMDTLAWINQQIRLWEEAVERNELEKAAAWASNDFDNVSISGGATFSKQVTSSTSDAYEISYSTSSAFTLGASVSFEYLGIGTDLKATASFTESRSANFSSDQVESTTFGYVLSEPDVGDFVSMNVYEGANGNGPIFLLTGGETSCPHEEAVTTLFHQPGTELGATTFQRDKPRLEVAVSQIYNVPADAQAAFSLTLYNDSESNDGFNYAMHVIDESNPDGAVIQMDGEFFDSRREIFVPGGGAINKTVTLERGPFEYDYKDIKVVLASVCQSDPTDFERIIADTVSISAFFLPICTTPEVTSPGNNWTLTSRFNNQMSVEIGDFDINFPGFEYLELQYKASETSSWVPIQKFYRDLEASGNPVDGEQIPRTGASFSYLWDVSQIPDGNYDLRVVSDCEVLSTGGRVSADSGVKSGIIDRINPHVFGSPQPGDGVLSPGDEISVQFNEPIKTSLLSPAYFSITGVLNGGELNHNVSVGFDGTGNEKVTLPNQPNLRRRNFTIDFWARRNDTGEEVILHQGATASRMMQIGFDDQDQVYFEMNGNRFTTDIAVTGNTWTHYSLAFDYGQSKVTVTVASGANTSTDEIESFEQEYEVDEPVVLGQSTVGEVRPFEGNLHELRIWSKVLSETEIAINRNLRLNASVSGLLANWPFDEAVGSLALDIVKVRQAQVAAGWSLEPSGKSIVFDGTDDYLQSNGIGSFDTDQHFSLEFWFKTSSTNDMTIFSTGKGDESDDNTADWSINILQSKLNIAANGETIDLDGLDLADGSWHHFALTVNRTTNILLYVDGEQRKSVSSDDFPAFANDLFAYGRRAWRESEVMQADRYFDGLLDEFRLWNTVRSQDEITYNRYNKLTGEELGLVLYYPFEAYQEQAGILISQESTSSQVAGSLAASDFTNEAAFSEDVPAIRLPRPLSAVNFNYSANGDKIILTTNEDNDRLENVILNIGVKDIRDLNGNKLEAPITWTAFVDRNDVVWLEDDLTFDKPVDEAFSFTAEITNTGGQLRNFTISNLPFWLTASPASGQIKPVKSETITFTVNPGLNIGAYNEQIHLTTEFGFDEKLNLELNVYKAAPANWSVNSEDFQSSMSVVGQVAISGIVSRDKNDLLAAFVGDECRGVASLEYFAAFGNYQAFLSIYTDVAESEDITYKIWDASEGKVYTGIEVSDELVNKLTPDGYFGEPSSPIIFSGSDQIEQSIGIEPGWQWISFNLASGDLSDLNTVFKGFEATENDQIKGISFFDQYDPENGWIGTLSANGGLQNEHMYKLKAVNAGKIAYNGSLVDAPSKPISLSTGWNWLGFYGQQNQDINEALSDISDLAVGDRIKGQLNFAVYAGDGVGWVGSLKNLKPGEGYMYLTQADATLTYPEITRRLDGNIGATSYNGSSELTGRDFGVISSQYESNMNFIIRLEGHRYTTGEQHILVKANGKYVGWGDLVGVEGQPLFFVTVHGDNATALSFELVRNGEIIPITPVLEGGYEFARNANMGSVSSPERFLLPEEEPGTATVIASPNPFNESITVTWAGGDPPQDLRLLNLKGELVTDRATRSDQSAVFSTSTLSQGMYLVQVAFADRVEVLKVIKSR